MIHSTTTAPATAESARVDPRTTGKPDARSLTCSELIAARHLTVSPVEPGLFDAVSAYAERRAHGTLSRADRKPRPDHPLIRFHRLFFADLLAALWGWRGEDLPPARWLVGKIMDHDAHDEIYKRKNLTPLSGELMTLAEALEMFIPLGDRFGDGIIDWLGADLRRVEDATKDTCAAAARWALLTGLDELAVDAQGAFETLDAAL